MWRSRARSLLRRLSTPPPSPIPPPVPPKTLTLTLIPPPHCLRPPTPLPIPRFLSSSPEALSHDDDSSNPNGAASADFEDSEAPPTGNDSPLPLGDDADKGEVIGDGWGSLWEDSAGADDPEKIFASEESAEGAAAHDPEEFDVDEEVEMVREVVETADDIERALNKRRYNINGEVLSMVIQTANCSAERLVTFFRAVSRIHPSAKTPKAVGLLISTVGSSAELSKKEAYMLWDLIKEIGKEKGLVITETLNQLISLFWRLEKAKAGLEVFEKFDDFGCSPDGDSYYFTIEALGKHSMVDAAWAVGEKMLNSGRSPDGDKMGRIIHFFCKNKKPKEAHLVYSMAKEKKMAVPGVVLDFLVGALSRNDETVHAALELLDDNHGKSLRSANNIFSSVVHGLCRIKDLKEAKKLLLRMVNLGPAPGNAVFNYVITALSKAGEVEEAKSLMNVMDTRGLRPDVYTYSVIMSGYAKGGLMAEAHELLREAKKKHRKLSPITYHILIRGYCKMEEFEKALECLKEMKEDGMRPNSDEYNKLIQSLCLKAMDWRSAEKLLEEMEQSGLYLKGITRSLIAAIKELEEEEIQSNNSIEA